MRKNKTLYVAYGSNLNIPQMGMRCPLARVYGVGILKDYRLVFKALGSCAYATIEPFFGEYVPVVVWEIGEVDEIRLDRYEGFPTHYYKEQVSVYIGDERVEGMVYIMNRKARYQQPNGYYFDVILEGYRSFRLETYKLYEALYREAIPDDSVLRHYRYIKGMTQKQLARESGVKEGLIQKYESGERNIKKGRGDIIIALARVLEIPAEELLR